MTKYRTTIQPADRNPEIAVVVEYEYHKGSPGRLSGPPENCYPPEPAYIEIESITHGGINLTDYLADHILIDIEQEIEADMDAAREAAEENAAECMAEYRAECLAAWEESRHD